MIRGTLINSVRDTPAYEKYNGKTLSVDNFSEESFDLLLQGLEENNIDIKPQLDNLVQTFEEQNSQEVIPTGADVMDYFNPSTGMFSAFTSEQEKENSLKNTQHSIELLNYLETKDEKAKEVYEKYLETIFPESEVKDIVFHSTPNETFEEFDFDKPKTDPFTKDGAYFTTEPYAYKNKIVAKLDIKNPIIIDDVTDTINKFGELEKSNRYDSAIGKSTFAGKEDYREYVVFNPEQIHILGSQKDQEMFKEFVEKEKNNKKVTITIGKYETGATVDSSVYENIPTTELSINEITRLEPGSKMDSEESKKVVQEIINLINQGKKDELPPIIVRALENGYQIIDGHHRYEACLQTGTETIAVKIVPESEIEIIYKEDSDIESPLERFGISSLDEFQEKFFESDQELMKTGNFDYKNNELLNNQMKDYLEEIDSSQISEQAKQKQAEMLWLWYHHAAQDAKERYQENEKAIKFIDKALEYKGISNGPNEITELLSLLYRNKFNEAESYIQNMDDIRKEQQEDGSTQEVINYEKETAQKLFEYYKSKN